MIVAGTAVTVALAGAVMFLVVRFAAENPEKANLGSPVLRLDAERLAREIAERGPLLFKDPLGRDREVYVQHVGDDPRTGWVAVRAYASRASLDCLLQWERARSRFVDPCTGETFPADGRGLTTYRADVAGGEVRVDLRSPRRRGEVSPPTP